MGQMLSGHYVFIRSAQRVRRPVWTVTTVAYCLVLETQNRKTAAQMPAVFRFPKIF